MTAGESQSNVALSLTTPCDQATLDALRQRYARVVTYDVRPIPALDTPFYEAYASSYIHWVNSLELVQGMLNGQQLDLIIAASPQSCNRQQLKLVPLDERQLAAERTEFVRSKFDVWFASPSVYLRAVQFWRFAKYLDVKHLYVHTDRENLSEKAWDFWLRSQRFHVVSPWSTV